LIDVAVGMARCAEHPMPTDARGMRAVGCALPLACARLWMSAFYPLDFQIVLCEQKKNIIFPVGIACTRPPEL
jgi:hypothetical protein